jgi:uncharacterized protein (DUF1697 family)
MTELKGIFETLGFADVSTFIASGNVIFTSRKAPASLQVPIESALQQQLGYAVATMLRSSDEVARVADYEPFTAASLASGTLYVGFMRTAPAAAAVKKTLALQTNVDALHVNGREVYWLARKSISEATITGAAIEKALQTPVTLRNINTVRRLAAKFAHPR